MDEDSVKYFDLSALLRLSVIDVRKVSRNDMSLLTGDYFALLSKLLSRASSAKENLKKLAVLNQKSNDPSADGFIITNLENLRDILEITGCEQQHLLAAEIVRLSKRGNKDYIAGQAKKLIADIDVLCNLLFSCQIEKPYDPLVNVLGTEDSACETNPLHKAIKLLEQEQINKKPQILAVDDSANMLKTISSILSDKYKVYGISNPLKVKDFLNKITPNLFILDYKMPELSGFDLIPIIRNFDKHKDTPIIILTSTNSSENVSAALKLGACGYIVKPFQAKQLQEKIAKHIANRK